MRQIRQMADAIAALVLRVRAEGNYESGLEAVRETAERGLGVNYKVLERLDPASAAMLLRATDALRTYAWICGEEADLLERAGNREAAAARRGRAIALYRETAARDPAQDGECRGAAALLAQGATVVELDESCRRWLAASGERG